jgi:hypothetical protein
MTPQEIVRYYGDKSKAARGLGMARRTIQNWCSAKSVPHKTQHWVEFKTGGKLKAKR